MQGVNAKKVLSLLFVWVTYKENKNSYQLLWIIFNLMDSIHTTAIW